MGIAQTLRNPNSKSWKSVPRTYMSAAGFQSEVHPTNLAKVAVHEAKYRKEVNIFREDMHQSVHTLAVGQRVLRRNLNGYKVRIKQLDTERNHGKPRDVSAFERLQAIKKERAEALSRRISRSIDDLAKLLVKTDGSGDTHVTKSPVPVETATKETEHAADQQKSSDEQKQSSITAENQRVRWAEELEMYHELDRQIELQEEVNKEMKAKKKETKPYKGKHPSPVLVVVEQKREFAKIYETKTDEGGDEDTHEVMGVDTSDAPQGKERENQRADDGEEEDKTAHSRDTCKGTDEEQDVNTGKKEEWGECEDDVIVPSQPEATDHGREEGEEADPFPEVTQRMTHGKNGENQGDTKSFMRLVRAKQTIHLSNNLKLIDDIISKSKQRKFNFAKHGKGKTKGDVIKSPQQDNCTPGEELPVIREEFSPADHVGIPGSDEVQSAGRVSSSVDQRDYTLEMNSHVSSGLLPAIHTQHFVEGPSQAALSPLTHLPRLTRKPAVFREENKFKYHDSDKFLREEKQKCHYETSYVTWKQSLESLRYVHFLSTQDIV